MLPQDLQELSLDTPVELFELSGFNLNVPEETVYFCNYYNVMLYGNYYEPVACEATGYEVNGEGAIAQPEIVVSNIARTITNWLSLVKYNAGYRLLGTRVTKRVSMSQYLDNMPLSGSAIREISEPEIFYIEQRAEETYKAVKFKLGSPLDVEGMHLPGRMVLRQCSAIYRNADSGCPYVGNKMYDLENNLTTDSNNDRCSKTPGGCKARFGENVILPYLGFVGLATYS